MFCICTGSKTEILKKWRLLNVDANGRPGYKHITGRNQLQIDVISRFVPAQPGSLDTPWLGGVSGGRGGGLPLFTETQSQGSGGLVRFPVAQSQVTLCTLLNGFQFLICSGTKITSVEDSMAVIYLRSSLWREWWSYFSLSRVGEDERMWPFSPRRGNGNSWAAEEHSDQVLTLRKFLLLYF